MGRLVLSALLGLLSVSHTAQADLTNVNVNVANPAWSITASYDDTTGQPSTLDPALTVYDFASLMITVTGLSNGTVTFDETDVIYYAGADIGISIDPFGNVGFTILVENLGPDKPGLLGAFSTPAPGTIGEGTILTQGSSTTYTATVPVAKPVAIDIKPGSEPNCFNINGHGVIPVAILGDDALDVGLVDPSSLIFGGLAVRVRGNRGPLCGFEDVNVDGFYDLVCHFEDDASAWESGNDEASLSGQLWDGTAIEGSDSICVVP